MPSNLADSEWRIMLLLWERPMTMPEILAALKEETGWTRHSLISFLNRMIKKGAIRVEEERSPKVYHALWHRDASIQEETHAFIRRLYRGDAGLLISSLVDEDELGDAEIDALHDLIESKRKRRDG